MGVELCMDRVVKVMKGSVVDRASLVLFTSPVLPQCLGSRID